MLSLMAVDSAVNNCKLLSDRVMLTIDSKAVQIRKKSSYTAISVSRSIMGKKINTFRLHKEMSQRESVNAVHLFCIE